jgi:hypothetical protein
MALTPFTDGFPNDAVGAINASYFLSSDDKTEWNEWLKSADAQQQDELVNILHTMWEEAQKQQPNGATPPPTDQQSQQQSQPYQGQANNNQPTQNMGMDYGYTQQQPQNQPSQTQNFGQPNPYTQQNQGMQFGQPQQQTNPQMVQNQPQNPYSQFDPNQAYTGYNSQPVQPTNIYPQNQPAPAQNQYFDPNYGMNISAQNMQFGQPQQQVNQYQQTSYYPEPVAPVQAQPEFSFAKPPIDQNIFAHPESNTYIPNPLLANVEIPAPAPEPKPIAPIVVEPVTVVKPIEEPKELEVEDAFSFDTEEDVKKSAPIKAPKDEIKEIDTTENTTKNNIEEEKIAKRPTGGSIDFTNIRENVRKDLILQLKESYVQTRTANEETYGQFVEKITEVLCEFEDINDYIEAMTDKVLSMNDEVISQASDIQALKNATQNRGASLQDQVDEVRYDLEKILKEIRNVRIEMKRSNDEIRQRLSILEADSFRQENDGINQKLTIMKSEISRLQEIMALNNAGTSTNPSDPNATAVRISKLDTISFKKNK